MDPILAVVAVHALAGAVALGSMVVPLASRKGSPLHRKGGRVYARAMAVVVVAALVACALRVVGEPAGAARAGFLAMLAVQAGTNVWSGLAVLRARSGIAERVAAGASLAAGAGGVVVGALRGDGLFFAFGLLTAFLGWRALRVALAPPAEPRERVVAHLVAMIAACIATMTAFVVVNAGRLPPSAIPGWVWWVAPAAIGVPAMRAWSVRWSAGHTRLFS